MRVVELLMEGRGSKVPPAATMSTVSTFVVAHGSL